MSSKPPISVITVAFNAAPFIGEAIESILSQTFADFEYLIIDDCSTDETLSIAKKYAGKDARIKVFHNDKNLYIAANRNKGISLAEGKYIVWQDADDISMPSRISELVGFMESHLEVGICGSYFQSFDESGNLDIREYAIDDVQLRKNIFKFSPVAQPTAIVRKECFDKVGLFNLEFPPTEDLEFAFRLGSYYKFANVPKVLLKYREHAVSATKSRMGLMIKKTLLARRMNIHNKVYKFGFTDYLAYVLAFLAMYLPADMVNGLFKAFRRGLVER